MSSSVLDECGMFADDLVAVADMVLKSRGENEQQVDRASVEEEVFSVYQDILYYFGDGSEIAAAVKQFRKMAEKSPNDIQQIGEEAIKVVMLDENIAVMDNKAIANELTVAAAMGVAAYGLADSVLTEKFVSEYESTFDNAKDGDENAIATVETAQYALRVVGGSNGQKLSEVDNRRILITMMRLAANESETSNEILANMAKAYDLDVFSTDENGIKSFDVNKLQEQYREAFSIVHNSKGASMTIDDFKAVNARIAKKAISSGKVEEYKKENGKSSIEKGLKEGDKQRVKKEIMRCFVEKDKEGLDEIIQADPDQAREIIKWRVEIADKLETRDMLSESQQKFVREARYLQQREKDLNRGSRDDER